MRRINSSTAAANANGTGRAGFVEGSLAQQIPTTHFTPEWCNSVQEEIARAIESTGATLNGANHEQLTEAIHGLRVAMYSGPVNSEVSFHPAGWVQCDILFINVESGDGVILGLGPSVLKRVKKIYNAGNIAVRLVHGSTTPDVGRRIYTQNFSNVLITRGQSVDVALATPTVGTLSSAGQQAWFTFNDSFPAYNLGLRLAGPISEAIYTDIAGIPTPKTRSNLLPLFARADETGSGDLTWKHTGGSASDITLYCELALSYYALPFRLPAGATLLSVRALLGKSNGTGATELRVYKSVVDKSSSHNPNSSSQIGSTGSISASGRDIATIGNVSEVIDNSTTQYHVSVLSSSGATGGAADTIHWIEVIWADIGPRNF